MADERRLDELAVIFEQALERPPEERTAFLDEACGNDSWLRAELHSLLAHHEEAPALFERLADLVPARAAASSLPPERAARIQSLFDEIIELDAEARAARLDEACHDDPALRQEIESLLAAYEQADDVLHRLDRIAPLLPEPPSDPSYAGKTVSHYEVVEKLGGGGMGVVYIARDVKLDRLVALKFLPPHLSADDDAKARFVQEAKAASALDHANLCTVHEIGETEDGQIFIAMAYYRGETLKTKIKRGPLPLAEALDYARQMARGLGRAHEEAIFHRDVKPANVMITERGVVKIVDFGLAKMADVQLTRSGTTMGTVSYMSPEQSRGEKVDQRTDVWSLGVVLYEMLTGVRPFQGDYAQSIMYAVLHEEPRPLREVNPDLPEDAEHIVAMCLEKVPDLRYPSMEALLTDLDIASQQSGTEGSSTALRATPRRKARRKIALGAAAGGVLLLIGLLFAVPASRTASLRFFGELFAPPERYIAVLPLVNDLDDTTANQALADGLTQRLTGMIARLESQEVPLSVVPASEVARLGVTTAAEARKLLGVDVVLEGSMQRVGETTELILNLVNPTPEIPRLLGSETVAAPLTPALDQAALSALSNLLGVQISDQIRQAVNMDSPTAPGAYGYYFQGLGYLRRSYKEGIVDLAIEQFSRALEEDVLYAPAHAGLCEARWVKYEQTHDADLPTLALRSCEEAEALAGDQVSVLVPLGRIYEQVGQPEKAEAVLLRALDIDPDHADAYSWLGRLYEFEGDAGKAEAAYRQAIAMTGKRWHHYEEFGQFLFVQGRYREALEQFEQVRRLTPDNFRAYIGLASTQRALGQVDKAIRLYQESASKQPNAFAYQNLGSLYFYDQQYGEAVRALEKARDLDEGALWVWPLLGHSYHWNGQHADARRAWEHLIGLASSLLDVDPRHSSALLLLAETHILLGNHADGRRYLDRLLALPRKDNFTPYYVGRIYEMLGNRELALDYIKQALKDHYNPIFPDRDPWLKDLRSHPRYQEIRTQYQQSGENASL